MHDTCQLPVLAPSARYSVTLPRFSARRCRFRALVEDLRVSEVEHGCPLSNREPGHAGYRAGADLRKVLVCGMGVALECHVPKKSGQACNVLALHGWGALAGLVQAAPKAAVFEPRG